MPEFKGFDLLVFGLHTEAFQFENAMKIYFGKLEPMNKKAICLVTHQFPFNWMGGNGAVNKMKALCEEKGLDVVGTAVAVKYIAGLID